VERADSDPGPAARRYRATGHERGVIDLKRQLGELAGGEHVP
jgi:hypothetical protein